jgi:hypothetical protein
MAILPCIPGTVGGAHGIHPFQEVELPEFVQSPDKGPHPAVRDDGLQDMRHTRMGTPGYHHHTLPRLYQHGLLDPLKLSRRKDPGMHLQGGPHQIGSQGPVGLGKEAGR